METNQTSQPHKNAEPDWVMPKAPKVFSFINETPILQSLLYDIDLLPEQVRNENDWFRIIVIVEHFRLALAKAAGSAQ